MKPCDHPQITRRGGYPLYWCRRCGSISDDGEQWLLTARERVLAAISDEMDEQCETIKGQLDALAGTKYLIDYGEED